MRVLRDRRRRRPGEIPGSLTRCCTALRPQAGSSQPHIVLVRRGDVAGRVASAPPATNGLGLHRRDRPQHGRGGARGSGSGRSRPHPAPGHPRRGGVHSRRGHHRPVRPGGHTARASGAESIALIREQGGLVYLPHPFDVIRRGTIAPEVREQAAEQADIVEVLNGRSLSLLVGAGTPRRLARRHAQAAEARAATRTGARRWAGPT